MNNNVIIKFWQGLTMKGKILVSIGCFLMLIATAIGYQGCVTIVGSDDERFLLYQDKEAVIKNPDGQQNQESNASDIYNGLVE